MAQANRPEGLAGGGRGAGGITGAGGRYVNPVYKEVGPTVKVKPADPTGRATFNVASARRAMEAKSGAAARIAAQKLGVTGKKGVQPPIKINTNPVKNTEKKRTLKEMKEFNNFISSLNAKSKAKLDAEIKKLK